MSKNITLEGKLTLGSNGEEQVLKLDREILAELVQDVVEKYGKLVSVRYWTSDEKMSKEKAQHEFLKTVMGFADVEYNMAYSECTGYLWTDESLKIGGHDLLDELYSKVGKYLILEIDFHDLKTYEVGHQEAIRDLGGHVMDVISAYIRDYKWKAEQATNPEIARSFGAVTQVLTNLKADINTKLIKY